MATEDLHLALDAAEPFIDADGAKEEEEEEDRSSRKWRKMGVDESDASEEHVPPPV